MKECRLKTIDRIKNIMGIFDRKKRQYQTGVSAERSVKTTTTIQTPEERERLDKLSKEIGTIDAGTTSTTGW